MTQSLKLKKCIRKMSALQSNELSRVKMKSQMFRLPLMSPVGECARVKVVIPFQTLGKKLHCLLINKQVNREF
jgi:hypothetical protein